MYKLFILIALVGVVLAVSGCASWGPKMSSPAVYGSSRDRIVAENKAHETYWKQLDESYETGTGGSVVRRGALRVPGDYHQGIFKNRRSRPVTFIVSGRISLTEEVAANSSIEVLLIPGSYDVALYEGRNNWPYLTPHLVVDRVRDNVQVDGQVYDFFMIAP